MITVRLFLRKFGCMRFCWCRLSSMQCRNFDSGRRPHIFALRWVGDFCATFGRQSTNICIRRDWGADKLPSRRIQSNSHCPLPSENQSNTGKTKHWNTVDSYAAGFDFILFRDMNFLRIFARITIDRNRYKGNPSKVCHLPMHSPRAILPGLPPSWVKYFRGDPNSTKTCLYVKALSYFRLEKIFHYELTWPTLWRAFRSQWSSLDSTNFLFERSKGLFLQYLIHKFQPWCG